MLRKKHHLREIGQVQLSCSSSNRFVRQPLSNSSLTKWISVWILFPRFASYISRVCSRKKLEEQGLNDCSRYFGTAITSYTYREFSHIVYTETWRPKTPQILVVSRKIKCMQWSEIIWFARACIAFWARRSFAERLEYWIFRYEYHWGFSFLGNGLSYRNMADIWQNILVEKLGRSCFRCWSIFRKLVDAEKKINMLKFLAINNWDFYVIQLSVGKCDDECWTVWGCKGILKYEFVSIHLRIGSILLWALFALPNGFSDWFGLLNTYRIRISCQLLFPRRQIET